MKYTDKKVFVKSNLNRYSLWLVRMSCFFEASCVVRLKKLVVFFRFLRIIFTFAFELLKQLF